MNKNIDRRAASYLSGYIGIGGSVDLGYRRGLGWAERQPEGRGLALAALAAAAKRFGAPKLAGRFTLQMSV